MSEIISKLSSYNIINYLIPGVLFVGISKEITEFNFTQEDIFVGVVVYYFIGLVLSRVSSLVIEPLYEKINIIKKEPYEKYVLASQSDNKIDTLSEQNSMYRVFVAMFLSLLLIKLYEIISNKLMLSISTNFLIMTVAFFVLFSLAYRKQTSYIVDRIKTNLKQGEK